MFNMHLYCIFYCTYIGALYFTIANLDPGLRSKLEAIYLVSLFHYSLLDTHSFDEILHPLIADIKGLQQVL